MAKKQTKQSAVEGILVHAGKVALFSAASGVLGYAATVIAGIHDPVFALYFATPINAAMAYARKYLQAQQ